MSTHRQAKTATIFEERHGRPKPPEIIGASYVDYARRHNTLMVYKDSFPGRWCVWLHGRGFKFFPSHAEAIAYAQAHAQERTPDSGLVQSR